MSDMESKAADKAVTHDSGWVDDGHAICWNGPYGAFIGHTEDCPRYNDGKMYIYLCSPGCAASDYGIMLNQLPYDEYLQCAQYEVGMERIQWRLQEVIHPDLTIKEQMDLCVFQIKLDVEDERND